MSVPGVPFTVTVEPIESSALLVVSFKMHLVWWESNPHMSGNRCPHQYRPSNPAVCCRHLAEYCAERKNKTPFFRREESHLPPLRIEGRCSVLSYSFKERIAVGVFIQDAVCPVRSSIGFLPFQPGLPKQAKGSNCPVAALGNPS